VKRPQSREPNGQFKRKPAEQHVLREGTLQIIARGTRRGVFDRLKHTDPAVAAAHRKFRNELLDEFGRERVTATAGAMASVIAQSKLVLDTIDVVLLELGDKLINKNKRAAYPLIQQRMRLADSLVEQLASFNALKHQHSVEERLERLEALRHGTQVS
jgi:hypothetical protein